MDSEVSRAEIYEPTDGVRIAGSGYAYWPSRGMDAWTPGFGGGSVGVCGSSVGLLRPAS